MKKEQKFKPKSGQVDFTHIRWAPVINCILKYKDKILLVQRNENMRFYPSYWNGLSGFLDDDKSLEEKVLQELKEEAGLEKRNIISIKYGNIFDQDDLGLKKTWIVHPVLIMINTDKINLDWEARKFQWMDIEEVYKLDLLPGCDKVLDFLFDE